MKRAKENPLYTLLFTLVLPTVILNKFSGPEHWGPRRALLLALAIPLVYGAIDYLRRREHNLLAAIGLLGVVLSGGLGLLEVDGFWFAVKEAAIPSLLGTVVVVSSMVGRPLISRLLLNDQLLDMPRLNQALEAQQVQPQFQSLLVRTNLYLGSSFFLSAVLNFVLAIWLLKSPAGSPAFNAELARMNALSFVVIAVPSMAFVFLSMWLFFRGLKQLTGLQAADVLRNG